LVHRLDGTFAIQLASGETLVCNAVIVATPAYAAARLLETTDAELAMELNEIEYTSVVTVSVAYARTDVRRPLYATGYVVPRRRGRPVPSARATAPAGRARTPPCRSWRTRAAS